MVREGLPEKWTSKQRPEGSEEASHADVWVKGFLGRGNSQFRASEVRAAWLLCLRKVGVPEWRDGRQQEKQGRLGAAPDTSDFTSRRMEAVGGF